MEAQFGASFRSYDSSLIGVSFVFPASHLSCCDMRFRMATALTKIAILVCSNLALQICKLATNLTRQECKRKKSLRKRLTSLFWYPRLGWETSLFPHVNNGKVTSPYPTGGTRIDPLVTTHQNCHKLAASNSLETIANAEYEHNLGLEPATYRVLSLSL
ncbi:hypothetical protein AVEN_62246-1 [Araneus ventricosus]|uniref:Uncharacterized protein n=1 Tax=Araneus ventricosus TaxID=182803 RepID=A0A4Y2EBU6_ARAVE|nr:hypothetical protein AVEN_62246-1 [Araneus ventricosus]